jgi:hypothetical protein
VLGGDVSPKAVVPGSTRTAFTHDRDNRGRYLAIIEERPQRRRLLGAIVGSLSVDMHHIPAQDCG